MVWQPRGHSCGGRHDMCHPRIGVRVQGAAGTLSRLRGWPCGEIDESHYARRDDAGRIMANVFAGGRLLQSRLISDGVGFASCEPTVPGDTCYRILRKKLGEDQ